LAYTTVEFIDELRRLQKELAQARLNAEIYEAMYDTKLAECKELRVKLGRARIFEVLGNDLHEEHHTYITKLEEQRTSIRKAIDRLCGFWDGNSLRAIPGFEYDIREAWYRLLLIYRE